MTEPQAGLVARPYLAGHALTLSSPEAVEETVEEVKTIAESGNLRRREVLAHQAAGLPIRRELRTWTLRYRHLRGDLDLVERILSGPGPFSLCLWRPAWVCYRGDGSRVEFSLPWAPASPTLTPPNGLPASLFDPAVRLGVLGTPLAASVVDSATYATGPGVGEAQFLEAGRSFKLEAAPGADTLVYARLVPLFYALQVPRHDKRLRQVAVEPRDIVLVEEGAP